MVSRVLVQLLRLVDCSYKPSKTRFIALQLFFKEYHHAILPQIVVLEIVSFTSMYKKEKNLCFVQYW